MNGALLAYPSNPAPGGPAASGFVWRIIDATSGQTVRESEPLPPTSAAPLSAQLDGTRLRTVSADGSILEVPILPNAEVRHAKFDAPFDFAVFSPDGNHLVAALPQENRDEPRIQIIEFRDEDGKLETSFRYVNSDDPWASPIALAERFPWAHWESPFWEKMFGQPDAFAPPLRVTGSLLESTATDAARTPIRAESQIESVASSGNRVAVGTASGMLTVHEFLEPLGYRLPPAKEIPETEGENGWKTIGGNATSEIQERGRDWRLKAKDGGHITPIQQHPNWMYMADAALPSDSAFIVQAGYSAGSGGYSSAGMIVSDATTGEILTDLEPVSQIRSVSFLGDRHRVAAIGASEVIIADVDRGGFRRVATLAAVDAHSLHYIASREQLAVATPDSVRVFDARDFSLLLTLPVTPAMATDGYSKEEGTSFAAWAEDAGHGWLAFRNGRHLDVWSLRTGRRLVSSLVLPSSDVIPGFAEKDGMAGLSFTGAIGAFVPIARIEGVDASQLTALRGLSECLSGMRFAGDSRALAVIKPQARHELAASLDAGAAESFLPGSKDLVAKLAALAPRSSAPTTWEPVWDRLALGSGEGQSIARWAADLGKDHPWFRGYVRSLIGESDGNFFTFLRGETPADQEESSENLVPEDDDIGHLHRLAGDPEETADLKRAAWLVLRTANAGKSLTDQGTREDFPDLNFDALEKLEPAALEALRKALDDGEQSDWRIKLIDELAKRPAAVTLLDARVASTLAAWEAEATPARALDHAQALAFRGELAKATEFLTGKIPDDTALTLEQAHFLIASRLSTTCPAAVEKSLDALSSSWLRAAWLSAPGEEPLASRVERIMTAVGGQGRAAISALHAALRANDAAAIATGLRSAKDIPPPVRDYATARALWAEGKKAEVFAMWTGEMPDFHELEESSDWGGWEAVMNWEETNAFADEMEQMASSLKAPEGASIEDLRALGEKLMAKEATATFGVKRVREALVACALGLADDAPSSDLVTRMVDRARLTGASHPDCLRIEARSFMAQGEFTAAYARWLQLIDNDKGDIAANDYVYAARCVLEDMQDAAAIELLNRGKDRFPFDSGFALDAAWLLLTTSHPEDAGVMLEHGFKIPFPEDMKQTATAMLLCAAEQTNRMDRADQALQELLVLSPDWGDEKSLKSLDWPEALKQNLLAVAKRNRGPEQQEEEKEQEPEKPKKAEPKPKPKQTPKKK
ncbi:MAG TPA: hypothetical protein VGE67_17650 [Haloferula sp.]